MKRLREAIALYRIYRQVNPPLRAARLGTDMKHWIRHYIGAWRLARINNTRINAIREMLNTPF